MREESYRTQSFGEIPIREINSQILETTRKDYEIISDEEEDDLE